MSTKKCCPDCFCDPGISSIIPIVLSRNDTVNSSGRCGYCQTESDALVEPKELNEWFGAVLECYVQNEGGKLLSTLLREDWALFDHPRMDEAHVKELLSEIFDNGEIVRCHFSPVEHPGVDRRAWDELGKEMMHRNRWFLNEPLDLDSIGELFDQLIVDHNYLTEITPIWSRARLTVEDRPYSIEEMGAPPKHKAGHGRANPAGIPYLYLASTADTAVSELRPHTGEFACVASFKVKQLRVLDLCAPRKRVSPFLLGDTDKIIKLRAGLSLLDRLGEELTKPVHPRSAAYEYIPSQYLCEFIKTQGYRGVMYRSSVSNGVNLALFDPSLAEATEVKMVRVERVTVKIGDLI